MRSEAKGSDFSNRAANDPSVPGEVTRPRDVNRLAQGHTAPQRRCRTRSLCSGSHGSLAASRGPRLAREETAGVGRKVDYEAQAGQGSGEAGAGPEAQAISSCSGFQETHWRRCGRPLGPGSPAEAGGCPVASVQPGPFRCSPLRGSITPAFLPLRRSPAGKVGGGLRAAHSGRGLLSRTAQVCCLGMPQRPVPSLW